MSEYLTNTERRIIIVIFFDLIERRWYFENLSNVILILLNEIIIRRIDGNETLERMRRQIKGLYSSCGKLTFL